MMFDDPNFYNIEQLKTVGMWPLTYLSGHVMVPYIKRMKKSSVVGLEVGVLKGETARVVLDACPNVTKYYGIDPYVEYFDNDHLKSQEEMNKFKATADANLEGYSRYELVEAVPEKVDFMLIDGQHTYDQVKNDLSLYYDHLNDGGIIFCHDYNNPEVNRAIKEWRREYKVSQPILVAPNFIWIWYK
jgi:predicted O-methyltransferase YrrM